MSPTLRRTSIAAVLLALPLALVFQYGGSFIEARTNRVVDHAPADISADARRLHASLVVGDWHADTLMWRPDLLERADTGHVDIPRLREGNVALQMFTTVSKVPMFRDHVSNNADTPDAMLLQALLQTWPLRAWSDLTERTLLQGDRLLAVAAQAPEALMVIRSQEDLKQLLARRAAGEAVIGGLLGVEGGHALEGRIGSLDRLYERGFRMIGLQHFFDNALGGSLHGQTKGGLTPFGREVVERMDALDMIIDLAHASEAVVADVLAISKRPPVVSHTGFRGNCDKPRNIPDALVQRIVDAGGLVAVGFWAKAICDASPEGIVASLRYGIDRFGIDHIALGSDFDGGTTTHIDSAELATLTQGMLEAGFSEGEIRQVMGGNMVRFLRENLPAGDTPAG
ncbi:membrane dipeptidase [Parahaliea mediterranea]|uniref:Dipeptidase n=1 Tax=Parahaliea mediterranea TaxID=651086 RepID=A0A939DBJ2_9GAMM|nr:dipeptidase [Parahaliea mediterranea]